MIYFSEIAGQRITAIFLHLLTGNTAIIRALFGQGVDPIWLDNVNCIGTEARLADCSANTIGVHNCAHFEDAGVRCEAISTPTPSKSHDEHAEYSVQIE